MSDYGKIPDLAGRVVSAEYVNPDGGVTVEVGVVHAIQSDNIAVEIWFMSPATSIVTPVDRILSVGDRIQTMRRISSDEFFSKKGCHRGGTKQNTKQDFPCTHAESGV